ncbi:MAG: alpha/beta hydrolase [Planctomycetota bacterium]
MQARSDLLSCVEIEPKKPARCSIVWLHGLGADGNDFVPIVPHLGIDEGHAARFVFPHAPKIPVSLNMGMVMPAWYDIAGPDLRYRQDVEGIRRSEAQVRALVEREIERGVPSRKILLAGFSQGGAVAVHVALRFPQPLAGAIALSTYLVMADALEAEIASANRGLPVFQAHGSADPMVHIERGEALRDELRRVGCEVDWREYPMMHEVCLEEIEAIGSWMRVRLQD